MRFWMPRYKYQYVEWLKERYQNDKSFNKMGIKQLKAIYISIRSKE